MHNGRTPAARPDERAPPHDERAPLLAAAPAPTHAHAAARGAVGAALTCVFIAALVLAFTLWNEALPRDPHKAALAILAKAPVIDGHIDLPIVARAFFRNNVSAFDLRTPTPGHVDIPRLRAGRVGGFFWSVYVDCAAAGPDFLVPSNRVRDTLEQIDVAHQMIARYDDVFQLATDVAGVQAAIAAGKIASLLGVEGAHQLGNSLGALRAYHALGVRYVTLTHTCNNAFADSGGIATAPPPAHNGLSALGRTLIAEMNRLGVLVDLAHTSDATALQALAASAAPVLWSHAAARALRNVSRNVPDAVLRRVGRAAGKTDAVVMVNFAPQYVADGNATVHDVADHIAHIGAVAGRDHVGIGSDFDGIATTPRGLEDAAQYPQLFAVLRARGWSKAELVGLAGGNLLRVLAAAEAVARAARGAPPAADVYAKRTDL